MDITTIPNFETLSEEQKKFLEAFTAPDDNAEAYSKLKAAFDKTSRELSTTKKSLAEKQSADERAAAEKAEADRELQEKYDALLKESTIAKFVAKYSALGMDEKLATATAEAQFAGETDKVFANLSTLRENNAKAIRADVARNAPTINSAGGGTAYKSKAEIMAIKDPTERQNAISENMALFTGNTEN